MLFYVSQKPSANQLDRNQTEYIQPAVTSLPVSHADTQRPEAKLVRLTNQGSVTAASHTHSAPLLRQQHKGPLRTGRRVLVLFENAAASNNTVLLTRAFPSLPLHASMPVSISPAATMSREQPRQSFSQNNPGADANWNYLSSKPCLATGQTMRRTPKHTRRVSFDVRGDKHGRAVSAVASARASMDSPSSCSSTNSYCSCCESSELGSVTHSFSSSFSSASSSSESGSTAESTSLEAAFRMYELAKCSPVVRRASEFLSYPFALQVNILVSC
ncbi:unnamed protein product [Schistocephalus solidus]|uniref:Uncharacterized protein n=1 Tax=Schistocephalus solidus TaxID=70667 RepID=A0A183SLZ9_SCHSO|nr:unnamed protein product [Schistocephalus solidus]